MIGLKRHPSWHELNRLADDEMETGLRAAALKHVAACARCSREVSQLHQLREAGREMRHPSPPKDLLDDILRDRAAGARVILPVVPLPPRRRRMLPAAAAAAIMAGLAGLATLTLTSEAGAGASELTVDPATPVPGEQVRISYRPATDLAGEAALRLRLRLREPDSEPPRGTLGEYDEVLLLPDREGRYVASFQLPEDFAFATMAVESLSGDGLDDHGGRLWSVRAHADDGAPLASALRQEFMVLQNRSWPEARRCPARDDASVPRDGRGLVPRFVIPEGRGTSRGGGYPYGSASRDLPPVAEAGRGGKPISRGSGGHGTVFRGTRRRGSIHPLGCDAREPGSRSPAGRESSSCSSAWGGAGRRRVPRGLMVRGRPRELSVPRGLPGRPRGR